MIRFENSVTVDRDPTIVFNFVVNFETLPKYDRYVISAQKTSTGPIGVGSTWTHIRTQGPQKIVAPITLTEFDPPRRFVMESGSGGFEVRSTMTFEPSGDGVTKVTEVLEMKTKGLTRLFEPMIKRQVPKQGSEVHDRLKEVIEALPTS
ncbi:SRPBCC family protein [Paenarthrobacter aromaticivorans]|uniref:SRPBCC family protein n=1 Tax=Paenarthrobacter aromaticivorans TaxID=2849150 RepID=A0ABS6I525_9MICC|nr:SRPBCC family protein [Paenarthrobacter sp. MMS21-TAE1-1]MBU8865537.1 SRPBCC family protein [Paenarthrobacter sp. MMS21-TAE1-1]